jgi:hypothetical protein
MFGAYFGALHSRLYFGGDVIVARVGRRNEGESPGNLRRKRHALLASNNRRVCTVVPFDKNDTCDMAWFDRIAEGSVFNQGVQLKPILELTAMDFPECARIRPSVHQKNLCDEFNNAGQGRLGELGDRLY